MNITGTAIHIAHRRLVVNLLGNRLNPGLIPGRTGQATVEIYRLDREWTWQRAWPS